MATFVCRVQFLDDTDPFNSTNFPEPSRAPLFTFREDIPLINQLAGVHRLLQAPHKLDDCALQLSHNGTYLDLESSLAEQRDELEGFQQDDTGSRGKKHSVILRTQLTVRVHACIERLYNSNGRDLRRALFSLKQIFQDDKDLVHEFVMAEGLTCLIKVGAEADQNYQNYILRALGQIMLYVDGMNGVISHPETIQWLYTLVGSKFRLVVKTALKLLLVFVEYSESNAPLLIQAITSVDTKRDCKPWSNAMEILHEKDGVDTELLVYAMTLINKTLAALPDQDSFYDLVDGLEEQGMETVSQRHLGRKGTDLDLVEQLNNYELTLRHEDGDDDSHPPPMGRRDRRRASLGGGDKKRGLERRRSRRASLGRSGHASPCSPASPHRVGLQEEAVEEEEEEEDPVTESDSNEHVGADVKACVKEDEPRTQTELTIPPSPSPLSPPTQPSLLVSLLARKRSVVTVPASKEVSPPLRGSTRPSPDRLPYLPHSPFHLFSYDLDEDRSLMWCCLTLQEGVTHCHLFSTSFPPSRNGGLGSYSSLSSPNTPTSSRLALGGLLSSSYRQHQESLAAERERRRVEREERLQKIEREERNNHMVPQTLFLLRFPLRYKTVERLAAEEFERDRVKVSRTRPDPNPTYDPVEAWPSSSRSSTPSSFASQDDTEADLETETPAHHRCKEKEEEVEEREQEPEKDREEAEDDSGILSDKERQNEEVNEKDNCSASSISSASSTLEREERGSAEDEVNEKCSKLLDSKLFMLDMLYSQNKKPSDEDEEEEEVEKEKEVGEDGVNQQDAKAQPEVEQDDDDNKDGQSDVRKGIRPLAERFGDLIKDLNLAHPHMDGPATEPPPPPPPPPPKKESDTIWDQLLASPRELRIRDINFTDLTEEDDKDILDAVLMGGCGDLPPPPPPLTCFPHLPPPPPMFGSCPPPPPMIGISRPPPPPSFSASMPVPPPPEPPMFNKKKKTIRLFWSEVRLPVLSPVVPNFFLCHSFWTKLEPVKLDTAKLEHLFETKSKEIPVTKKTAADGKRQEIIVLDSKRSNAINIGLTVLPPPRTIKTAILNFDEYALNKEGIEKILTMIPTEEEKQRIQEAQLANPDVPLGSAEQFLLTLSSISELSARLQLWAFKMDYEATEKEVAEPLQDLKEGMDQLEKNKTLRYILSTLLSIGNFLNSTNAKGFELTYLEKVPEVKDTVHKQSLLHHACSSVVENFPHSTDLYSEIGAITRSAKVDFDQLQENLCQMERRCKASWDHLKVIAKHEMKPQLKQKMSDFLKDCAERIIILKIVHRRIINRFHSFLLFLGHPAYSVREISVHRFSKILSEFALEYRTTRDRVLQQKQKRADHRERNKTRGKMIMDSVDSTQPQGLSHAEDAAEHEHMKAMLRTSLGGSDKESSAVPGLRTRTRSRPGRGGRSMQAWTPPVEDTQICGDEAADEIMERIVRSATQGPGTRAQPRERRRSRANRKSRTAV
uniref:FH1/FH2 domain-containing protein 3-like n=1 Tax=Gouania willdenowi TaxID=441366 RepID=A0A8C5EM26_GOUWI